MQQRKVLARFGRPVFRDRTIPSGVMLSMPIIIDVSSLSLQIIRSMVSGGKFLPGPYRWLILAADLGLTAAVQYYVARKNTGLDGGDLPMGSRVRMASGRWVRPWPQRRKYSPEDDGVGSEVPFE